MGGFPPPHITWWIGTRQLQPQQTVTQSLFVQCTSWEISILFNSRPQKKEYQGVATSKLLYVPDITDDGHYLTCRSPRIISSRLKQRIFCQTIASTSQGASWRCYGGESGRHVGDQSALWVKNIFYLNFSLWEENLSQTSLKSLCVWEPRWIQTTFEQVKDDDYEWRRWWTIFLLPGNDVYFECEVRANPIPHKLIWLHNVSF